MTKIFHYQPQLWHKFICKKGGLHSSQSLNYICLDPLCRNDPLACSVCYTNTHKYHKVITVDKFIDQYSRNIGKINTKTFNKIQSNHKIVQSLIKQLRKDMNNQLETFQHSIHQYANELKIKTSSRQIISHDLKIPLDIDGIKNSKNNEEFIDSIKFILNNSLFDSNNNMINVVSILKQNQERIYALMDKMINMTSMSQQYIKEVMNTLNFADSTLKQEKISFQKQVEEMKLPKNSLDSKGFANKQQFNRTLHTSIQLRKSHWHQKMYEKALQNTSTSLKDKNINEDVLLRFNTNKKHSMIQIKNKSTIGVSNITALKPQYALLTPHLNIEPNKCKEWVLKINNCRNFASENTLGIGLAYSNQIKNHNFQGYFPKGVVLLTSQGYVIQNGQSRRTDIIFGAGDTLYCKYDPFYKLLTVTKENDRIISLRVDKKDDDQLCACVRLTYASDQVQIL